MPDTIDTRSYNELQAALALAQHTVYKQYLTELSRYPLVQPNAVLLDEEPQKCIRAFQLTELTCRKGEDIFQKLSTVYHASMSQGCSLFVMIDVESVKAPAKIYFGVRSNDDRFKQEEERRPARLMTACKALQSGLESNFPGSKLRSISASVELPQMLDDIFGASTKCISSVSCVASSRKKDNTENKAFIQGIERLIDAMRGHTYTALLIAEPVTPEQQSEIRNGYESLYSTLSSFRKSTWSYNENESKAVMDSLSKGIAHSITEGTSHTQSHTTAKTKGTANTVGIGVNIGGSMGQNTSESQSTTATTPTGASRVGAAVSGALSVIGTVANIGLNFVPGGVVLKTALGIAGALGAAGGAMQGGSTAKTITEAIGKSFGLNGNVGLNASRTWSQSTTESDGTADTTSHNDTNTTSETKTTGTTDTTGTGRTLQIENINKPIEELLKRIEEQLVRVREGEDYGAYSCGAYFLSGKQESSILAANTYRALMLGEGSSVESGAINTWTEQPIVQTMKEYLRRFEQPVFALPIKEDPENEDDLLLYSPGTIVSGLELPLHLGVPTKSVIGLPVIEHAEFGRNVHSASDPLVLGRLYHMGQKEQTTVPISVHSLASHAFITGSTGAGKSNTVYHLLDELDRQNVKFLVIQPAKGEYKNVFGGRENVSVYGTNTKRAPLLRLNPFSFPEDTHVLEHIDRLVEIFNACWPMYAAMPAVLKDAVERVYINCGWSLTDSTNVMNKFPTFADLKEVLPAVVQESNYSADTQSDYIGALVTRVKSLTNGINGQIFCSNNEIPAAKLFDENVIVDLSRVGSMETKSLLMGVLVLKLQEHRMASGDMNANLRHVTVMEEAHNLLRRTSDMQSQESSNLQGKSVEMIANAIAEMRTYGEGFIIADQAPGLMDPAVIRNTNTKIIMRLPDESDRELVGKAASLNDDQIVELAKLPLGVAAVYQNAWLEPVLCKIDHFEDEQEIHVYCTT
ncbi:MAG: ATP-binding protein [Eubacteriales bacterium]